MLPVKIHTYILDIKDENPHWKWDHELTEYYNMTDLSPQSFDELATRILNEEEVAIKYHNTMDQHGGETFIDTCDYHCRKTLYCEQRNSVINDAKDCLGEPHLDFQREPLTAFLGALGNPWYRKIE